MARMRADLTGSVTAHRRRADGRVIPGAPLLLSAGDEVPDGVRVDARYLDASSAPASAGAGAGGDQAGGPGGAGPDITAPARPQPIEAADLADMTVDEVNRFLDGRPVEDIDAVLDMEAAGLKRKGITGGRHGRQHRHP